MNVLLDSCTFLWIIQKSTRLSKTAEKLYLDTSNTFFLSIISIWEMTIKYQLNKLFLEVPPSTFFPEETKGRSIRVMNIQESTIYYLESLPEIHKDLFDRILICQAIQHGYTILTPDKLIRQYPVKTLW